MSEKSNKSFTKQKAGGFSKAINIALWIFIGLIFIQKVPTLIDMFKKEGNPAPQSQVTDLKTNQNLPLPMRTQDGLTVYPQLIVFWATWCGPCKIELSRINSLVKSGQITPDSVIAISSGEDPNLVRNMVTKEGYQFKVALDPDASAAKVYNVKGTPTLILVDKQGKINWMTMGLSATLEMRILSFFD